MRELDLNPNVIQWSSEEPWFSVSYINPVDNRPHRYFPDFWVKAKTPDGTVKISLIEVKPKKETIAPPLKKNGGKDKRYVRAAVTYAINSAKWEAASKYCEKKGWEFKILNESHIK